MTISSEVQNLQTNLENSYTAVSNKGGTLPQDQCFDNLPTAITSIPTGTTPTGTISITQNGQYDVTNYATADVNVSGGGGILETLLQDIIAGNNPVSVTELQSVESQIAAFLT